MSALSEFHFLRPWWLLALLPLAGLLWMIARRKLRGGAWESVCDSHLLPFVLLRRPPEKRSWPVLTLAAAGLLAILALAGPAWERLPQAVFRTESALVIALDLSRSMDATDIKPSRLVRARFKVADILARRHEGQTALIVYAYDAFTVTPLTDDTATIAAQLPALTTDIMPRQGSRAEAALAKAQALLEQAGLAEGDVLLITDGQAHGAEAGVRTLRDAGFRLSIIGVGSPEGAPIPLDGGSFLTDRHGAIVVPRLEESWLRQTANLGGGRYAPLTVDEADIERVLPPPDRLTKVAEDTSQQVEVWREHGPWLLLALLPLAAFGFRRGALAVAVLALLPWPGDAVAFELSSMWLRPDQQASRTLEQGEAARAAEQFEDPAWKAAAHYRAKNYEQALEALQELEDADSHYNRGNALAQLGRYREAIDQYERALELNPDNEDARHNRDLLEELPAQPSSQPQGGPGSPEQNDGSEDRERTARQDSAGSSSDERPEQSAADSEAAKDGAARAELPPDGQRQETDKGGDGSERQQSDPGEAQQEPGERAAFAAEDASQDADQQTAAASTRNAELDESEQAAEQWLRRIPDDPGGLWRRKFLYQYRQQKQTEPDPGEQPW